MCGTLLEDNAKRDPQIIYSQSSKKNGGSLRSYVKRFNREALELDEVEDKVQLTTFKARLKSKEFMVALAKSPSESMTEMLLNAQKYMNAEDALASIRMGNTRKENKNTQEDSKEETVRLAMTTSDQGTRRQEGR